MRRTILKTVALALVVGLAACASADEDTVETTEQEARAVCYSSDDCAAGKYCTTEDGDCNSACRPNQPCIDVCTGTCKKGSRQPSTCDYSDPSRTYYAHDVNECAVIRFVCAEGQSAFFDDCGCGCE